MTKISTRDIATSFTSTIFIVIGISGVMMFFHFNDMLVKELHEILGLGFVLAAVLHILTNWKSMKRYFSKKIFIAAAVMVAIVSGVFVSQSLGRGDNPKMALMQKVLNAPLADSLKLLNGDYDTAIKNLKDNSIEVGDATSIDAMAKANKTSPFRIVGIAIGK